MSRSYPTNVYANASAAIVNAYPFSIGLWFQNASASPADNQNFVVIGSTGVNSNNDNIGVFVDQSTKKFAFFVSDSSGTFFVQPVGAALTAGAWHAGMMSAASATSRTGYLDGGSATTDTSNAVLGTSQAGTWFGAYEAGAHSTTVGPMAEVAIWNVALTAGEAAAHAAGVPANRIRPLSLKGYWPLYGIASPEPDLSGFRDNMTDGGGSSLAANHPPITLRTARRPLFAPIGSGGGGGSTIVERRSLSLLGARAGSRQAA